MQIRRGTPDSWRELNPILEDGQLGFERLVTVDNVQIGDSFDFSNNSVKLFKSISNASSNIYEEIKSILYIRDITLINGYLVKVSNNSSDSSKLIEGYIDIKSINKTAKGSTSFKLKIGDGVTPWNDLPYIASN